MVLRPPQIVYAEMLGAMGLLPLPEEVSRKIGDMIQAADESGVEELPSKATIVLEPRHNDYFWGIYNGIRKYLASHPDAVLYYDPAELDEEIGTLSNLSVYDGIPQL